MNFFALGIEKATIYANREWGKAEVNFGVSLQISSFHCRKLTIFLQPMTKRKNER